MLFKNLLLRYYRFDAMVIKMQERLRLHTETVNLIFFDSIQVVHSPINQFKVGTAG